MSGKSTLVFNLIENIQDRFDPIPQRVVYAYGAYQKEFENFPAVEFVEGLEKILEEDFFSSSTSTLLIIDDLLEDVSKNPKASALFTRGIHHKNITVLFLAQNLFKQGSSMRDITLNSQYFILFKNSRDVQQIKLLARQCDLKHLLLAYNKCIKQTLYGYLLIDIHPKTPDLLKLQSDIFGYRRVYVAK